MIPPETSTILQERTTSKQKNRSRLSAGQGRKQDTSNRLLKTSDCAMNPNDPFIRLSIAASVIDGKSIPFRYVVPHRSTTHDVQATDSCTRKG